MPDIRKRKSPLKKPPLRQAGQSLKDHRDEVWERIIHLGLVPVLLFAVAVGEWARYVWNSPPNPWFGTVIAALGILYFLWRARPLIRQWRQLDQGIQGEIHVGHSLETLREKGFRVLHDIPGDGWNIDHVLIGTKGVFMIETKTPSKPHPKSTIRYDGSQVLIDGLRPDRDPLIQAKAAASWLQDFIHRRANRKVPVRAVLIYPNWYIEGDSFGHEVWVMHETTFLKAMATEREKIGEDDVALITDVLGEYARNGWDNVLPSHGAL